MTDLPTPDAREAAAEEGTPSPEYPPVWDEPSSYVVLDETESQDLAERVRKWRDSGYDPALHPARNLRI